jgi:hypothetical protein
VLIGDPRAERARTLAGMLDALGFDVTTVSTGRQFALQAFSSPDCCFGLMGDAIDNPRFEELIQILRRDARTADLPIGVLFREQNTDNVKRFAESDPLSLALAYPQTGADMAADAKQLLLAAGRRQMPMDERIRHALFALDTFAKFAEGDDYEFYDVMRQESKIREAMASSVLATKAARVLGLVGSPTAQRSLVEFASMQVWAIADRQAAVEAFKTAVERRGLLLTRRQLIEQYDRYNRSGTLDQDTQNVLASILDAIEAPSRN